MLYKNRIISTRQFSAAEAEAEAETVGVGGGGGSIEDEERVGLLFFGFSVKSSLYSFSGDLSGDRRFDVAIEYYEESISC